MSDTRVAGPKDILLHIFGAVALYWCAFNFGALLFNYIDLWLPDPLDYGHYLGGLRWALATLTVVFPVLVWVQRRLRRDAAHIPAVRALKSRKWILYITLFAAGLIIMGGIVAVLYQFLEGELTLRFVLKIFTVLIIAKAVMALYVWHIKRDSNESIWPWMEHVAKGITLVGVVVILAGYFIIPSPSLERLSRYDERRVQDLQNIQWQIVEFWRQKGSLPNTLDDLKDSISGYMPPSDPKTSNPYEYRIQDKLRFELCAVFASELAIAADSKMAPLRVPYPGDGFEIWAHGKGRVCFDRTIDPERYQYKP